MAVVIKTGCWFQRKSLSEYGKITVTLIKIWCSISILYIILTTLLTLFTENKWLHIFNLTFYMLALIITLCVFYYKRHAIEALVNDLTLDINRNNPDKMVRILRHFYIGLLFTFIYGCVITGNAMSSPIVTEGKLPTDWKANYYCFGCDIYSLLSLRAITIVETVDLLTHCWTIMILQVLVIGNLFSFVMTLLSERIKMIIDSLKSGECLLPVRRDYEKVLKYVERANNILSTVTFIWYCNASYATCVSIRTFIAKLGEDNEFSLLFRLPMQFQNMVLITIMICVGSKVNERLEELRSTLGSVLENALEAGTAKEWQYFVSRVKLAKNQALKIGGCSDLKKNALFSFFGITATYSFIMIQLNEESFRKILKAQENS